MIRILIAGAESYIGTSVEQWLKREPFVGMYQIDTLDMRGEAWKQEDFSNYDTIFHVAGIAHQKETRENTRLYYTVNRNLPIETALKAKKEGVGQFVFLSSMSVYGLSEGVIDAQTATNPTSNYGRTKLEAETELLKMNTDKFRVAILRPPMVYGFNCKGNYQTLSVWAKKLPLFPKLSNKRSMLYIDNLSMFVQALINNKKSGIFLPQDPEYVCTSKMVKDIADLAGHKIFMIPLWQKLVKRIPLRLIKKVFGSLYYENFDTCKQFYTYRQALMRTEKAESQGEKQGDEW